MKFSLPILITLSVTHAIVDFLCIVTILGTNSNALLFSGISFVFLYNFLAFGFQFLLGDLLDKYHCYLPGALIGTALVTAGVLFHHLPLILIILLIGIGNALFHVGAGALALTMGKGKIGPVGVFVAPGAIGLFLGSLFTKFGISNFFHPALTGIFGIMLLFIAQFSNISKQENEISTANPVEPLTILGIFTVILLRSYVGAVLLLPWKSILLWGIMLTISTFTGKALGGYLADRYGWTKVGTAGLILSLPFLIFFINNPLLACFGYLLFNLTMPITVGALVKIFPNRPAFSFGITCFALLIGALPLFIKLPTLIYSPITITFTIISSAIFLAQNLYKLTQIRNVSTI